jgi:hypothetical protein
MFVARLNADQKILVLNLIFYSGIPLQLLERKNIELYLVTKQEN